MSRIPNTERFIIVIDSDIGNPKISYYNGLENNALEYGRQIKDVLKSNSSTVHVAKIITTIS